MIEVICDAPKVKGLKLSEQGSYVEYDALRQADIISIRRFVESQRQLLTGRVLDFGAGKVGTCRKPQPFRDLVREVSYEPYDIGDPMPVGDFDVILCTQVMQYVNPNNTFARFREWLGRNNGTLIMTYGTNWPECEDVDLYRYTARGMQRLLMSHGFIVGVNEPRVALRCGPNTLVTGYGLVAVIA